MLKKHLNILLLALIFPMALHPTTLVNVAVEDSSLFLEDLKHRTFNYFWELAHPVSGMVPDRAPTKSFSSIAATGFGLAAIVTGIEESYITREQGAERVLTTLRFFRDLTQSPDATAVGGYKGFFYHFVDMETGHRFKDVELSTIDTGLLMAGILTCYTYFDGENPTEQAIRETALHLYKRVQWDWAMQPDGFMSMGWTPEKGFIEARWRGYNEAMVLLIMALGSPTHPIADKAWQKWTEGYHWETFEGQTHVNFGPLFGHQYSHMFVDFRGIQDEYMRLKGIDYFENSRRATLSQQAYCARNPRKFVGYSNLIWGLTACDGPGWMKAMHNGQNMVVEGYSARGASSDYLVDDGTLAPTAAGGSIPFAPEICIPTLIALKDTWPAMFSQYGFKDAVNPTFGTADGQPWIDPDCIGIDQGPILIMLQNYQHQTIWNILKKNPFILKGLQRAGFSGAWLDALPNKSDNLNPY